MSVLGASIVTSCSVLQFADAAGNPTSLTTPPVQPTPPVLLTPTLEGAVTVQQALDQTLLQGPRAAAARAMLGIAKAQIVQAKILPNPAIEFDNGYAELSYRVGVAIPIEPPWKLIFRLNAAKTQLGAAELQMEQALWSLRADIRRAYTELVIAEESATMTQELTQLTRRLLDVASKRFSTGDVAKLDVLKAQLACSQSEMDSDQAKRRILQAREQLNILMGRVEDTELKVPRLKEVQNHLADNDLLPDLARPLPPLSQFIERAENDRLEIKIVKQEIAAAYAARKLTIGNIIPNGQLAFGYDRQLNYTPEPNLNRMYLMGSFPIPIFDRQQGELARLKATVDQLKLEQIGQQNIVKGQVSLAYRKLNNARENIRKFQETLLGQSEHVSELGILSYKLGQTDITAALTAQQTRIQVKNLYLNEVLNYQQSFTDLEQAVGRVLD